MKERLRLRKVRLVYFIIFICLFLGYIISVNVYYNNTLDDPIRLPRIHLDLSANDNDLRRRHHLQSACKELHHVKRIPYNHYNFRNHIYSSEKYNFTVCVVPKAGCSFLKQMVLYLNDNRAWMNSEALKELDFNKEQVMMYANYQKKKLFNTSRSEVHTSLDFSPIEIPLQLFKNKTYSTFKVVTARNPFSRLYSAYIDKFYIPALWSEMVNWNERKMNGNNETIRNICSAQIHTFEEFLEYVVVNAHYGLSNMHWAPVDILCNPCDAKPDFIIKQETYNEDVRSLLQKLNIADKEMQFLEHALGKQGVQTRETVRGLIKTMYYNSFNNPCLSRIPIAKRVWEALKIQGHVYPFLEFPKRELISHPFFSNRTTRLPDPKLRSKELNIVADVFYEKIRTMPIRGEESREHRRRVLARAYRNLRPELLINIQALYYHDFTMFDYDFHVPN